VSRKEFFADAEILKNFEKSPAALETARKKRCITFQIPNRQRGLQLLGPWHF